MIENEVTSISLLETPLVITDYQKLLELLVKWSQRKSPTGVEFCNTQVVAMRRMNPSFSKATTAYDYFIPDSMPLIWSLRCMGVDLKDRVYGPTFLRYALTHEFKLRHYFLGGSAVTSEQLIKKAHALSAGRFRIVGANSSFAQPSDSAAIVEEINNLSPDIIWVGLGTPKQQHWLFANKAQLLRGVILTVGFAFDVNAGTKLDAPLWIQRLGLTWLFRMTQEPRRLIPRYFKYNSLFLFYCIHDLVHYLLGKCKYSKR